MLSDSWYGNPTGMLIATCAGLLDADAPAQAMLRELREEAGYEVDQAQRIAAGGGAKEEDVEARSFRSNARWR